MLLFSTFYFFLKVQKNFKGFASCSKVKNLVNTCRVHLFSWHFRPSTYFFFKTAILKIGRHSGKNQYNCAKCPYCQTKSKNHSGIVQTCFSYQFYFLVHVLNFNFDWDFILKNGPIKSWKIANFYFFVF